MTQCKRGEILRSGYERRAYERAGKRIAATYVPPACIRDVGVPGKGVAPTVPPLRSGKLPAVGYNVAQAPRYRHEAIARGVKRYGRAMMQWRLEWEGTWRSRAPSGGQQREWSRRLLHDAAWLRAASGADLRVVPLRCPGRVRRAYTAERDGARIAVPKTCLAPK